MNKKEGTISTLHIESMELRFPLRSLFPESERGTGQVNLVTYF